MNHSTAIDIFHWAALLLTAGYALYAWFKLRNKPVAMIFAGAACGLSKLIPLMAVGLVLMVYGGFLMLRHQAGTSSR